MRNAYFVYDLDNYEIAIAQASYNQTGTSNIQAIPRDKGLPLPGVSITATGTATRLPLPTGKIASGTGGFISQDSAKSTGIPASAGSPTFSLGIVVPTTGSGAPDALIPSSVLGGGPSSSAAPLSKTAADTSSVQGPSATAGTKTATFVPSATFTGVASGLHGTESIKITALMGVLVAASVFAGMLLL